MNNINNIQNGDAMSGNEPTGARRRRKTKATVWLGVAGVCATSASLVPLGGGHTQAAFAGESEGMVCTNGTIDSEGTRVFDLSAADGYTSEPDGNAIYDWGFGVGNSNAFQLPGPVLCANQGDVITVRLSNFLPVATSIQFPGQTGVTTDGVTQVGPTVNVDGLASLVPEAAANGGTASYTFTASQAGTYLYESGSDPQLQVQMGLFGALVIYPDVVTIDAGQIAAIPNDKGAVSAPTQAVVDRAKCAYATPDTNTCDPLAIYDGTRENILMLSEVDPGVHTFMEQNLATPASLNWNAYPHAYEAHYFMINGRSMPDTVAPNNAPWLPTQPYGALAHVQPWDSVDNPLDALLRYVAVGTAGYDFHPHSNHERVIAEDGALMRGSNFDHNNTEEKFNILVNPGSTVDATFRWTNEVGYHDENSQRVPVAWPQGLNLQEGDFWSGSPYLGEEGLLNPGILTKTQCGEYYHVAHNHDLTQVTNYGITFGGMLTLIKVEPPQAVQDALNMDCG